MRGHRVYSATLQDSVKFLRLLFPVASSDIIRVPACNVLAVNLSKQFYPSTALPPELFLVSKSNASF